LGDVARAGAGDSAPARAVELLYFDDCPNYEMLLPHLRELLHGADASAETALRRISDDETAQRECFLGSPRCASMATMSSPARASAATSA
jgi:hypothetical protein